MTARRAVRGAGNAYTTRSRRGLLVLLLCAGLVAASAVAASTLLVRGPAVDVASPPTPLVLPTPAPAEPTPTAAASQPVPADPRPWVVPPSDLGEAWTTRQESTAGSTPALRVYEVDYATAADSGATTVGFSLFSALSTAVADAGLQQLRQTAEGRGVAFEPFPSLVVDPPAQRGRASLAGPPPSVSVVHLFRIETVVAAVEVIGPADQEASISADAEHAAQLQRDRLVAALRQ